MYQVQKEQAAICIKAANREAGNIAEKQLKQGRHPVSNESFDSGGRAFGVLKHDYGFNRFFLVKRTGAMLLFFQQNNIISLF